MQVFNTIQESWNYGQKLCDEYRMNGELEKAIAVDEAFQDTKLDVPEEIRIGRPSRFFLVGSSKQWARNTKLQRSHMKEIYHRAAEEPHNYHLMTKAEMIISMFTIAEQGPLTSMQTDVLLWLCDQIPIGDPKEITIPILKRSTKKCVETCTEKGATSPLERVSGRKTFENNYPMLKMTNFTTARPTYLGGTEGYKELAQHQTEELMFSMSPTKMPRKLLDGFATISEKRIV